MKTALVTGASMGIGEQIVRQLAKDKDMRIILVARSENRMIALKDELNTDIRIVPMDLCKENAVEELMTALSDENIDLLVNNAGFGDYGIFDTLDEHKMENMMALNMIVLTKLCYHLIPKMKKGSYILNVASTASFQAGPYLAVYAATKAYVLSLTEALHEEYAGQLNISALCPGPTTTNFAAYSNMDESGIFRWMLNMDPKTVAEIGLKKLKENTAIIIPGLQNKLCYYGSKYLPRTLSRKIIKLTRIKTKK